MGNSLKTATLAVICTFASAEFAAAQDLTKKYGEDSIACLTNISLYREVYRQKNYQEAYPYWKAVVADCPMSTKYIFTEGPVILEALYKEEKDSAQREQYLKELFDLFDLRIKCYPADEGYTLGRIGVYTANYRKKEWKEAFEYLDKSIDLEWDKSSPQVLDIYFKVAEVYMKNDNLSTDFIMDAYEKVSEVMELMIDKAEMKLDTIMHQVYQLNEDLEEGIINAEEYQATYEGYRKDSTQYANELMQLKNVGNNLDIRFSQLANCDMLKKIYEEKIKTSKDERTLRQIVNFFKKQKCTDNDIYNVAVEELHKIKPTAKTAYDIGDVYYFKKKQYGEALNYYKEAAELYQKDADKIKSYIMQADCHNKLGQHAAAREAANKILRLNPNSGAAYILIGDAYLYAVSSCNTDIPGAVYWAAADKYAKAKAVDASVIELANKNLNVAMARFPVIGEIFQRGYSEGQSYKIECWINETTTIRQRK